MLGRTKTDFQLSDEKQRNEPTLKNTCNSKGNKKNGSLVIHSEKMWIGKSAADWMLSIFLRFNASSKKLVKTSTS